MRDDFDVPMLPAELVGVDVSPWFRSVLLDRGQTDGVLSGMPVISEEGLVGLVTATSQQRRQEHDAARPPERGRRDGAAQPLARHRARPRQRGLVFEFVARDADVLVGDLVITSGLGGVYPKGLRIGEVTAVSDPGAKLVQTATLEPAVDFGRLEQVFVMLRRGPTMELLYRAEDGDAAPARPGS